MRTSFVFVLGLTGTVMLIGSCSSGDGGRKIQVNTTNNATASNTSLPPQSADSNTVIVANGAVVAPRPVDVNAVSVASSDSLQEPHSKGRMEQMRQADTNPGGIDAAQIAIKNARPAPDNSTFAAYLTDAGYEIRTFKNNPQILKVEKKIENNGAQSLKVFLRNGSVLQLPGKAIPVLSTASAASIANAAGVAAPPVKAAETGATGAKKAVN